MSNKRHLKQSHKQKHGQFYTSKANEMLTGWERLVQNKVALDPFCGNGDLLDWALNNGASKAKGYDIEPQQPFYNKNDSLMNPPDYTGAFLVSNPPYLASNKCRHGDKSPYEKWKQSDYYKCHLASLWPLCEEGILILPSNFFCESNSKARQLFFSHYEIVEAKYWNQPIFEDATTGIVAFHFRKGSGLSFPCTIYPENKTITMELSAKDGYMHGRDFFAYINGPQYDIERVLIDGTPNTNIVVGCLDKGKYPTGFHYNAGAPITVKKSVITTYQVSVPFELTEEQQKKVIEVANAKLNHYRSLYDGMFLSNYLGANQKILSQYYAKMLLCRAIDSVLQNVNTLPI